MREFVGTQNAKRRQQGPRTTEPTEELVNSGLLHAPPCTGITAEVGPAGAQGPADATAHATMRGPAGNHHEPRQRWRDEIVQRGNSRVEIAVNMPDINAGIAPRLSVRPPQRSRPVKPAQPRHSHRGRVTSHHKRRIGRAGHRRERGADRVQPALFPETGHGRQIALRQFLGQHIRAHAVGHHQKQSRGPRGIISHRSCSLPG